VHDQFVGAPSAATELDDLAVGDRRARRRQAIGEGQQQLVVRIAIWNGGETQAVEKHGDILRMMGYRQAALDEVPNDRAWLTCEFQPVRKDETPLQGSCPFRGSKTSIGGYGVLVEVDSPFASAGHGVEGFRRELLSLRHCRWESAVVEVAATQG
jgi:hypothetical protein